MLGSFLVKMFSFWVSEEPPYPNTLKFNQEVIDTWQNGPKRKSKF